MIISDLYLDSGYLNMPAIFETGYPFIFIPAARGTGKTYGSFQYLHDQRECFLHLRRTQTEADIQSTMEGTSFKPVMEDAGCDYSVRKLQKQVSVVRDETNEYDCCYNVALSVFANIRGISFNNIQRVVYDEFIAEPHVRKIRAEGMALGNFYESVNRNRELLGRDPVQMVCLANSVDMRNDAFMYFHIIDDAEDMIRKDEEIRDCGGGKLLIIPQHSPISEKKRKTALYQAIDDEFSKMALENRFVLNDFSYVGPRRLTEYICLFAVGDLYFYKHKSENTFYVAFKKGQCKEQYDTNYSGLDRMRRAKWRYVGYYMDGFIRFESYKCIALFEKYFNI